jgi:hypothetical protein
MLQDCSETMMVVCKIYEEGITKIMEPYVSKKIEIAEWLADYSQIRNDLKIKISN